ncbi:unnamed protein product [Candidula unifasciata]|uniref:G-protein coupled receptors family 1 profile domain-containing protein n=1 Tax=Candidula unifasciata TaxID=100452 RepID=A0A8S3YIA8_9EUPU|nr:unnamed protein product [Candidula unifasciata]
MSTFHIDHNKTSLLLPVKPYKPTCNLSFLDVTLENLNISSTPHMDAGEQSLVNMTVEKYLDYLNTSFAARLLPAVVVLVVLMAVGSKRGTVTLFIQSLAVFDLLSCCRIIFKNKTHKQPREIMSMFLLFVSSGEIIDMTNNYTFGSHSLCKIMRTVNLFCTVSSGATLVVVAIDRQRICCPLRKQITPKGATIVVCVCAVLALIISLPTAILYGSRSIFTDLPSVNGTDCSISDQFANTVFPIAYNGLQMLLFLAGAVILIVLYSLIGSKVCRHVKQQIVRRKSSCAARSRFSPGGASTCSVYSGNANTGCRVESGLSSLVNGHGATEVTDRFLPVNAQIGVTVNVRADMLNKKQENEVQRNNCSRYDYEEVTCFSGEDVSLPVHGTDCQMIDVNVEKCDVESTTAKLYLQTNRLIDKCYGIPENNTEVELHNDVQIRLIMTSYDLLSTGSRRTTLMLLMITLIYVLSFLPHLVLMALKAVDGDILAGPSTAWELTQNLLIRSYFINSVANPIIYSFFSRHFFRRCRGSRNGCSSG